MVRCVNPDEAAAKRVGAQPEGGTALTPTCVELPSPAAIAFAAVRQLRGENLVRAALAAERDTAAVYTVAGAGKAVGSMARGALAVLGARARLGVLVGKDEEPGLPVPVCVGGHPLPDQRSVACAEALLAWFGERSENERVLFLLSGGASALLGAPLAGVSLAQLRLATERLLLGGAAIGEINTVRRHLGRVLGGRLLQATRASVDVLALSDVAGDDAAAIGSGPLSADPTDFAAALAIARRYRLPAAVQALLERGAGGAIPETLKPGDARLDQVTYRILATPETLRRTAAGLLKAQGWSVSEQATLVEDEVTAVAERYGLLAQTLAPGAVHVAVGEPRVEVHGDGLGGRAQHLALLVARRIAGTSAAFLALGSDGSDGPTDAAGAWVDGTTWARAEASGAAPAMALSNANSHPLLASLGALVHTGPTGTNLLDLHLCWRMPAR